MNFSSRTCSFMNLCCSDEIMFHVWLFVSIRRETFLIKEVFQILGCGFSSLPPFAVGI